MTIIKILPNGRIPWAKIASEEIKVVDVELDGREAWIENINVGDTVELVREKEDGNETDVKW